jgi:hypothetical protein
MPTNPFSFYADEETQEGKFWIWRSDAKMSEKYYPLKKKRESRKKFEIRVIWGGGK